MIIDILKPKKVKFPLSTFIIFCDKYSEFHKSIFLFRKPLIVDAYFSIDKSFKEAKDSYNITFKIKI